MKITFQALLDFESINDALKFAKDNGFDGVEIGLANPHFYDDFLNGKIEVDLPLLVHSVEGFDIFTPIDEIRKIGLEWLIGIIKQARKLGVAVFTVHLGPGIPFAYTGKKIYLQEYYQDRFHAIIDNALGVLAQESIVAVENVGGFRFKFVRDLIQKYLGKGLKLTWDIGHTFLLKERSQDEEDFYLKNKDSIANIHIHDNHGVRDEHNIIGDGMIDFSRLFGKLNGWDGFLTVEVRPKEAALKSFDKLLRMVR